MIIMSIHILIQTKTKKNMKNTFLPWIAQQKEQINWKCLSLNTNAISILEDNLEKIDWSRLSSNNNAIPISEKNLDKVDR